MFVDAGHSQFVLQHCAAIGAGALATLFVVAGAGKLLSFREFRQTLRSLPYVPPGIDGLIAAAVVLAELLVVAGVCLGRAWAAGGAAVLLLLFSGVAFYAVRKRLSVPCNCFGSGSGRLSIGTVRRNLGLVVLAGILLLRPEQRISIQQAVCGGIVVCLVFILHRVFQSHREIRHLVDIGGLPDGSRWSGVSAK